jgi:ribose transport system substrate-binding protein
MALNFLSRRRRSVTAASACALMALTLGACGSSSSSSSSGSSSGASNAEVQSCIAKTTQITKQLSAPVSAPIPSTPFDMKKNSGKTIWFVADSLSNPLDVQVLNGVKAAAKAAGMSVKAYDGQSTVGQWSQGIEEAVAQHAAGIITHAIDPAVVTTAMKQAKAAGIPVVTSLLEQPGQALPSTVAGAVTQPLAIDAAHMADYVMSESGCKAHAIVITATVFPALVEMDTAIQAQFKQYCPTTCSVKIQNIDPATVATSLEPLTETLSIKNPNVNWFISDADALGEFVAEGLEAAHSSAKLIGQSGLSANLSMVRSGKGQEADISFPDLGYIGWLDVDTLGRAMQHLPTPEVSYRDQLFTTANIPAASAPLFPGMAGYQQKFETLWGLG